MGKIGFMLLGGAISITGLAVLILIIMLVSWIEDKIIMYKIKKRSNLNEQFTKAKELLKDITSSYGSTEVSEAQLYLKIKKAEQFLKEIEK